MERQTLVHVPETEEAYLAWVLENPHGFVINASKFLPLQASDQAQGMIWHRASCVAIDPRRHKRLVTGATMKACSPSPAALAFWAVGRGDDLRYCAVCCRTWRTPLPAHD
jgi:hypothetical protein